MIQLQFIHYDAVNAWLAISLYINQMIDLYLGFRNHILDTNLQMMMGIQLSFGGEHSGPDLIFHHDLDVAVVVHFVLFVSLACSMLPAPTGGTVSEIYPAVFTVEFWHLCSSLLILL